jgi:ribose transport system ATP-binding protein
MEANAIEVRNLNISFDGVKVLEGVDFTLGVGETHALVGANGAGKSTLVKILNGIYHKDSGEISVFGSSTPYDSAQGARERGIAMVYQDLSLVPPLTVTENIFLSRPPFRKGIFLNTAKAHDEAVKILASLGVDTVIDPDSRIEDISVGQQQLVEIAKALSLEPRILILDEPTASLSNSEINVLFRVIERLKGRGISIIYITHYLRDIFKICDRVTVLRDGSVVLAKPVAETDIWELVHEMVGGQAETSVVWKRTEPAPGVKPLLELENVTTRSIRDVSLHVFPGQVVGIAGLLGSGRTELFRALYGLDRRISGRIVVNGREVAIRSPSDALAAGIALVPEDRRKQGLVLDFSVEQNIMLPILRKLRGKMLLSGKKSGTLVDHYIKYLMVKTQDRRQHVRYLSGGNQQKIVVAKCLASEASVLLLDDPTFGVDIHSKLEIMRIVREFAAAGKAILFVSSEFKELAEFCDEIYILKKGSVSGDVRRNVTEDQLMQMVQ